MSSPHNDPVGTLPQKQEPYHEHTLSRRPEIGQHEFVITSRITNNADQVPLPPSADEGPSPFIQAGIARKHLQPSTVTYLDGSKYTFYTHKNAEGEILFDMVAAQLNLSEKDYFGLAFYDDQSIRHWLYKDKRIVKQLKGLPWIFSFEVKFYPPQPSQLAEDLTRYLLCLQLRRDVYSEKLPVSFATQAKLGALAAQSEYGDFDKSEEYISYLKNAKIAQVMSDELLDKVQELHKQYKGQTAPEAELAYLNECKILNMYGVHLFSAKDSKGKPVQVGVSSHGIGVYHDQMRIHRFAWVSIVKFSYRRNTFCIQLKPGELEKKETSVSYKLVDYPTAKRLWKTAVEHHTFFRLIQPEVKQKRSILSFGSNRFRYQGRTQIQSHMASQLFDSSVPTVDRATGRVVSQSADNIASKTPVYASPLHYADAQSRDLGSSPEKSYHVGHPLASSTTKKPKKGDPTANEVGEASSFIAGAVPAHAEHAVPCADLASHTHSYSYSSYSASSPLPTSTLCAPTATSTLEALSVTTTNNFMTQTSTSTTNQEARNLENIAYYSPDSSISQSQRQSLLLNDSGYYASSEAASNRGDDSLSLSSPYSTLNMVRTNETKVTTYSTSIVHTSELKTESRGEKKLEDTATSFLASLAGEEPSPYSYPLPSSPLKSPKEKDAPSTPHRAVHFDAKSDSQPGERTGWKLFNRLREEKAKPEAVALKFKPRLEIAPKPFLVQHRVGPDGKPEAVLCRCAEVPPIDLNSRVEIYHSGVSPTALPKPTAEVAEKLGSTHAFFGFMRKEKTQGRIKTSEKILRQSVGPLGHAKPTETPAVMHYLNRSSHEHLPFPVRYFVAVYHSGYSLEPWKHAHIVISGKEETGSANPDKYAKLYEALCLGQERLERHPDIETLALRAYCRVTQVPEYKANRRIDHRAPAQEVPKERAVVHLKRSSKSESEQIVKKDVTDMEEVSEKPTPSGSKEPIIISQIEPETGKMLEEDEKAKRTVVLHIKQTTMTSPTKQKMEEKFYVGPGTSKEHLEHTAENKDAELEVRKAKKSITASLHLRNLPRKTEDKPKLVLEKPLVQSKKMVTTEKTSEENDTIPHWIQKGEIKGPTEKLSALIHLKQPLKPEINEEVVTKGEKFFSVGPSTSNIEDEHIMGAKIGKEERKQTSALLHLKPPPKPKRVEKSEEVLQQKTVTASHIRTDDEARQNVPQKLMKEETSATITTRDISLEKPEMSKYKEKTRFKEEPLSTAASTYENEESEPKLWATLHIRQESPILKAEPKSKQETLEMSTAKGEKKRRKRRKAKNVEESQPPILSAETHITPKKEEVREKPVEAPKSFDAIHQISEETRKSVATLHLKSTSSPYSIKTMPMTKDLKCATIHVVKHNAKLVPPLYSWIDTQPYAGSMNLLSFNPELELLLPLRHYTAVYHSGLSVENTSKYNWISTQINKFVQINEEVEEQATEKNTSAKVASTTELESQTELVGLLYLRKTQDDLSKLPEKVLEIGSHKRNLIPQEEGEYYGTCQEDFKVGIKEVKQTATVYLRENPELSQVEKAHKKKDVNVPKHKEKVGSRLLRKAMSEEVSEMTEKIKEKQRAILYMHEKSPYTETKALSSNNDESKSYVPVSQVEEIFVPSSPEVKLKAIITLKKNQEIERSTTKKEPVQERVEIVQSAIMSYNNEEKPIETYQELRKENYKFQTVEETEIGTISPLAHTELAGSKTIAVLHLRENPEFFNQLLSRKKKGESSSELYTGTLNELKLSKHLEVRSYEPTESGEVPVPLHGVMSNIEHNEPVAKNVATLHLRQPENIKASDEFNKFKAPIRMPEHSTFSVDSEATQSKNTAVLHVKESSLVTSAEKRKPFQPKAKKPTCEGPISESYTGPLNELRLSKDLAQNALELVGQDVNKDGAEENSNQATRFMAILHLRQRRTSGQDTKNKEAVVEKTVDSESFVRPRGESMPFSASVQNEVEEQMRKKKTAILITKTVKDPAERKKKSLKGQFSSDERRNSGPFYEASTGKVSELTLEANLATMPLPCLAPAQDTQMRAVKESVIITTRSSEKEAHLAQLPKKAATIYTKVPLILAEVEKKQHRVNVFSKKGGFSGPGTEKYTGPVSELKPTEHLSKLPFEAVLQPITSTPSAVIEEKYVTSSISLLNKADLSRLPKKTATLHIRQPLDLIELKSEKNLRKKKKDLLYCQNAELYTGPLGELILTEDLENVPLGIIPPKPGTQFAVNREEPKQPNRTLATLHLKADIEKSATGTTIRAKEENLESESVNTKKTESGSVPLREAPERQNDDVLHGHEIASEKRIALLHLKKPPPEMELTKGKESAYTEAALTEIKQYADPLSKLELAEQVKQQPIVQEKDAVRQKRIKSVEQIEEMSGNLTPGKPVATIHLKLFSDSETESAQIVSEPMTTEIYKEMIEKTDSNKQKVAAVLHLKQKSEEQLISVAKRAPKEEKNKSEKLKSKLAGYPKLAEPYTGPLSELCLTEHLNQNRLDERIVIPTIEENMAKNDLPQLPYGDSVKKAVALLYLKQIQPSVSTASKKDFQRPLAPPRIVITNEQGEKESRPLTPLISPEMQTSAEEKVIPREVKKTILHMRQKEVTESGGKFRKKTRKSVTMSEKNSGTSKNTTEVVIKPEATHIPKEANKSAAVLHLKSADAKELGVIKPTVSTHVIRKLPTEIIAKDMVDVVPSVEETNRFKAILHLKQTHREPPKITQDKQSAMTSDVVTFTSSAQPKPGPLPIRSLQKYQDVEETPVRTRVDVYHSGYSMPLNYRFTRVIHEGKEESLETADSYNIPNIDRNVDMDRMEYAKEEIKPVPLPQLVNVRHYRKKNWPLPGWASWKVRMVMFEETEIKRPVEDIPKWTARMYLKPNTRHDDDEFKLSKQKRTSDLVLSPKNDNENVREEPNGDKKHAVLYLKTIPAAGSLRTGDLEKEPKAEHSVAKLKHINNAEVLEEAAKIEKSIAILHTRQTIEETTLLHETSTKTQAKSPLPFEENKEQKDERIVGILHIREATPPEPEFTEEKKLTPPGETESKIYAYLSTQPYTGLLNNLEYTENEVIYTPILDIVAVQHSGVHSPKGEKKMIKKEEEKIAHFEKKFAKTLTVGKISKTTAVIHVRDETTTKIPEEVVKAERETHIYEDLPLKEETLPTKAMARLHLKHVIEDLEPESEKETEKAPEEECQPTIPAETVNIAVKTAATLHLKSETKEAMKEKSGKHKDENKIAGEISVDTKTKSSEKTAKLSTRKDKTLTETPPKGKANLFLKSKIAGIVKEAPLPMTKEATPAYDKEMYFEEEYQPPILAETENIAVKSAATLHLKSETKEAVEEKSEKHKEDKNKITGEVSVDAKTKRSGKIAKLTTRKDKILTPPKGMANLFLKSKIAGIVKEAPRDVRESSEIVGPPISKPVTILEYATQISQQALEDHVKICHLKPTHISTEKARAVLRLRSGDNAKPDLKQSKTPVKINDLLQYPPKSEPYIGPVVILETAQHLKTEPFVILQKTPKQAEEASEYTEKTTQKSAAILHLKSPARLIEITDELKVLNTQPYTGPMNELEYVRHWQTEPIETMVSVYHLGVLDMKSSGKQRRSAKKLAQGVISTPKSKVTLYLKTPEIIMEREVQAETIPIAIDDVRIDNMDVVHGIDEKSATVPKFIGVLHLKSVKHEVPMPVSKPDQEIDLQAKAEEIKTLKDFTAKDSNKMSALLYMGKSKGSVDLDKERIWALKTEQKVKKVKSIGGTTTDVLPIKDSAESSSIRQESRLEISNELKGQPVILKESANVQLVAKPEEMLEKIEALSADLMEPSKTAAVLHLKSAPCENEGEKEETGKEVSTDNEMNTKDFKAVLYLRDKNEGRDEQEYSKVANTEPDDLTIPISSEELRKPIAKLQLKEIVQEEEKEVVELGGRTPARTPEQEMHILELSAHLDQQLTVIDRMIEESTAAVLAEVLTEEATLDVPSPPKSIKPTAILHLKLSRASKFQNVSEKEPTQIGTTKVIERKMTLEVPESTKPSAVLHLKPEIREGIPNLDEKEEDTINNRLLDRIRASFSQIITRRPKEMQHYMPTVNLHKLSDYFSTEAVSSTFVNEPRTMADVNVILKRGHRFEYGCEVYLADRNTRHFALNDGQKGPVCLPQSLLGGEENQRSQWGSSSKVSLKLGEPPSGAGKSSKSKSEHQGAEQSSRAGNFKRTAFQKWKRVDERKVDEKVPFEKGQSLGGAKIEETIFESQLPFTEVQRPSTSKSSDIQTKEVAVMVTESVGIRDVSQSETVRQSKGKRFQLPRHLKELLPPFSTNQESGKKKDKKTKKKKDAEKKKLKKVKKGVDVSSDSSSSSSSSDVEIEVKSRETKSSQAHGQQDVPTKGVARATTTSDVTTITEKSQDSAGPYTPATDGLDGQVIREEKVEQVYRIVGSGEPMPQIDPADASLSGTLSKLTPATTANVKLVEESVLVREKAPVPQAIKEASLPHTTVHTWHESTNLPEQVTTEVDEHGNVLRRTIVKAEQVKHTVQTQSYQTYAVDENTAPASILSHSPAARAQPPPPPQRSDVPAQGVSPVNGTSPIETHTRTVAYENGIRSSQPTTDDFEPGDLVSTKAVTTGNRTVETLTYKKERDGVIETHVEHRITIHGGDDIDHDAELSRAILEATNMNPEMTVEKVDTKMERH
ncbi:FERM central domain-containing protein [Ditylenchus destructor]|nr:FERM central domain-containing protein [Ditylenchus destructor]